MSRHSDDESFGYMSELTVAAFGRVKPPTREFEQPDQAPDRAPYRPPSISYWSRAIWLTGTENCT
jgi:hypothetical protein